MNAKFKEFGADLLLFLVAFAWGSTFLIVQDAVDSTPVYTFLFYRFLVATVLMALFSIRHFKNIDKHSIFAGCILGVFLFLGYAFQTFALNFTYSSTVGFITGLNVVIVPFLMYILFKSKISIFSIFGVLLAALGLYFLAVNNNINLGKGEFYTLICAIMFALQIVFTGYFVKKCDIYVLVVFQFLVVTILCFFGMIALGNELIPQKVDSTFITAIIITAVFATVFAFFVQTSMQRFTSAVKTAIIFSTEPVIAGIIGYCFANEIFTPLQVFGAVLIVGGMLTAEVGSYFYNQRKLKKEKK